MAQTQNTEVVPVWHKQNLTVAETVAYSGIGEHTLRTLMGNFGEEFVLHVGAKKMIKRKAFDEFMANRKYV